MNVLALIVRILTITLPLLAYCLWTAYAGRDIFAYAKRRQREYYILGAAGWFWSMLHGAALFTALAYGTVRAIYWAWGAK